MATDLTQDAVLAFLQSCGGSVRNSDLLLHFGPFLRDHPERVRNRELFKRFVNSVATVAKIDGVSNVVLRRKFQGHVPGTGTGTGVGRDSPESRGTSPAPSPALPAAGILAAEGGPYLRQVEHLRAGAAGGTTQVGSQDPEMCGTPVCDRGEAGQNRPGSVPGPGGPAVRHQDYVPESDRGQQIREEPVGGQENLHQNPFSEPIGGHVVNRQVYTPEPSRGQEVPYQDLVPSRSLEPTARHRHQDYVPESVRGQENLHQNPLSEPIIVNRQVHTPEPSRGQEVPYQDLDHVPSRSLEPTAGHIVRHQDYIPESTRGQENLHQNPIGGHIVNRQVYTPEPSRGQQVPHQDLVPSRRLDMPHHGTVSEPIAGHIVSRQDFVPDPAERRDIRHHGTVSGPSRGHIVSRQDFVPESTGKWDASHHGTTSEPITGHIVSRQDFVPDPVERLDTRHGRTISEPSKRHIVSRQDFVPQPIREQHVPRQNPVPESLRGHWTSHQDHFVEPFMGAINRQDRYPGPVRGQQVPHQGPFPEPNRRQDASHLEPRHVPKTSRGQNISYQDQSRDPLTGWENHPHNPEAVRGQWFHQHQEPFRGHRFPQNQELFRGQQIPPNPEPQLIPYQDPEFVRGKKMSYQNPVPELLRGQQNLEPLRQWQNPDAFRGQQIPQNLEPFREYQIPKNPEALRGQQNPQNLDHFRGQRNLEPPLREHQILQNPEPLGGQQNPHNPDHFKGQQIPLNAEHLRGQQNLEPPIRAKEIPQNLKPLGGQQNLQPPLRGKQIPQNLERLRGKQIPQNLEPLGEHQIPQNPEPLRGQQNLEPPLRAKQIPQNLEPLGEHQIPQNLEPLRGQQNLEPPLRGKQIPQNLEPLGEHQIPQNLEPLGGQQIPQNLEPLRGQQILQNPEPLRGQQNLEPPIRAKEIPQNLEPLGEHQIPQNLEPLGGQQNLQSPLRGKQIPQNLEPLGEQQNVEPPLRRQKISFQDPVPEPLKDPDPEPPHQEPPHQEPPQLHQVPARRFRHRQSYKSAVSVDEDEEDEEEEVLIRRGPAGGPEAAGAPVGGPAGGPWALNAPLSDTARSLSASSPCIAESSAPPASSSATKVPQIYIQDSEVSASQLRPEPGPEPRQTRRSLPPEAEARVFNPPSDSGSSRTSGWNISSTPGPAAGDPQEVLRESRRTAPEPAALLSGAKAPLHQSLGNLCDEPPPSGRLLKMYCSSDHLHDDRLHDDRQFGSSAAAMHRSTGDLYDDAESSDGSLDSPRLQHRSPAARRMSSRLKQRVYRSLETNLDRDEPGGANEAARRHRLHRISSSLSLPHHLSTSSLSSCASQDDLDEGPRRAQAEERKEARRSVQRAGQSSVPLEAREHAWMVKGAAGAWPDIYALFREDNSLLNRQDFISGFTVLHWIAKHGDHRVLNTLWYGVERSGLSFDVNAKSTAGQTPLHVAAIHGNKKVLWLLVRNFGADVRLRDTAGKKPWQYLGDARADDVLQLLGAPPRAERGTEHAAERGAEPDEKPRRRLRHHFSSASPAQRPRTVAQMVKVSRSSSIAALLKHRSHRF